MRKALKQYIIIKKKNKCTRKLMREKRAYGRERKRNTARKCRRFNERLIGK